MRTLNFYNFLSTIAICFFAFACQQIPEDENNISEDSTHPLKVKVRSIGDAEIIYPIYLYAFSEEGKLAVSQTIENEEKDMSITLGQGDYQIVAISGVSEDYLLPDTPDIDDVITLKGDKGAETPLMVGRADVEINNASEASVQISLKYAVAALNVKLKDVPQNVKSVQLAISPLHSTLSMSGNYGGESKKIKTNCSLVSNGIWSASTTYIFPGNSKETVFSIYFKTEDGTEVTYGYTYKGIPEANHLFNVTGSYTGGVIVGGNFDITDWEGSIDVEFEFGATQAPNEDEKTENDDNDTNTEKPDLNLSGVPTVGTIWNGTIVVDLGEVDETGVDLLLMTLDEWEATTSQVDGVLNSYSTNGFSNWRLPTHDEAALLRARFSGSNRLELNELISEYNNELCGLANGKEERYLCLKNGIYYSFQFIMGTSTTKAGEKRTYYLRLVKSYRYKLEN